MTTFGSVTVEKSDHLLPGYCVLWLGKEAIWYGKLSNGYLAEHHLYYDRMTLHTDDFKKVLAECRAQDVDYKIIK